VADFERKFVRNERGKPKALLQLAASCNVGLNELEEILPYVSENLFSWSELLDFRLSGPTGGAFSVHQAIYDLLREKGLSALRNQAIRRSLMRFGKLLAVTIRRRSLR
jgi:hypothetical protein